MLLRSLMMICYISVQIDDPLLKVNAEVIDVENLTEDDVKTDKEPKNTDR